MVGWGGWFIAMRKIMISWKKHEDIMSQPFKHRSENISTPRTKIDNSHQSIKYKNTHTREASANASLSKSTEWLKLLFGLKGDLKLANDPSGSIHKYQPPQSLRSMPVWLKHNFHISFRDSSGFSGQPDPSHTKTHNTVHDLLWHATDLSTCTTATVYHNSSACLAAMIHDLVSYQCHGIYWADIVY